jgi:hypothetical protein
MHEKYPNEAPEHIDDVITYLLSLPIAKKRPDKQAYVRVCLHNQFVKWPAARLAERSPTPLRKGEYLTPPTPDKFAHLIHRSYE